MLLDARASFLNTYVLKAGDTMTGALTISAGGLTVDGAVVLNEAQADVDFRVENQWYAHGLFLDASAAKVGVNNSSPGSSLTVNQLGASGACAVLSLEQADVSEEFIRYIGTSADTVLTQSIVDAADVGTFTVVGYVKIYVQDDGDQLTDQAYYQAFGTLAAP